MILPDDAAVPPAYFTDLIQDALHAWRERCDSMGYPPDLLENLKNKADVLEKMIDPIPNRERSQSK